MITKIKLNPRKKYPKVGDTEEKGGQIKAGTK